MIICAAVFYNYINIKKQIIMKKNENYGVRYGVGVEALDDKAFCNIKSKKRAIELAKVLGLRFIVEYRFLGGKSGSKILCWDYEVLDRETLTKRYHCDGDKRMLLKANKDSHWLVLNTDIDYQIILPLSKVNAFEKI